MATVNSIFSYFQSFQAGERLVDGGELSTLVQMLFSTPPSAIVALAGGGAAGAPVLQYAVNVLGTVAAGNDSVVLPQALAGAAVVVDNEGAQTAAIFAATTNPSTGVADVVIDNASRVQAASVTLASGSVAVFYCTSAGIWKKLVSA